VLYICNTPCLVREERVYRTWTTPVPPPNSALTWLSVDRFRVHSGVVSSLLRGRSHRLAIQPSNKVRLPLLYPTACPCHGYMKVEVPVTWSIQPAPMYRVQATIHKTTSCTPPSLSAYRSDRRAGSAPPCSLDSDSEPLLRPCVLCPYCQPQLFCGFLRVHTVVR